jgi:thiazole synthase
MSDNPTLVIRVNGEERPMPVGLSVAAMLGQLGLDHRKVAVERNREIVPRAALADVEIAAGDAFEIVHFVGGG